MLTPPLQAVIFDMDGLIVDSEPYWKKAEYKVFSALGCEVTPQDQQHTANLTTQAVTEYWFAKSPWQQPKHHAEQAVIEEVEALLKTQCQAKLGFYQALDLCRQHDLKVGLASNAPLRLCRAITQSLNCAAAFDCILSSEQVKAGKPAPDVYLHALKTLNASAELTLALEDSITGAKAAKSAGLKVIGIPSEHHYYEPLKHLADVTLSSLCELRPHHLIGKTS
ncbi:hexitol phosphatase HxpB [Thiomicrospira pelophila]|uniref:hexitol phosphatase HxpB n=1 Tax=Thiomicrospira pelophila TaxID=934 RepID=UPI000570BF66|nr:hexitol phosphatase HxpB [Thiomicrospira pelophila]